MKSHIRAALEFSKSVLKAETLTAPGRVNLLGMLTIAVIMMPSALERWAEPIARIFNSDYSSGGSSIVSIGLVVAAYCLLCVLILAVLDHLGNR